MLYIGTTSYLWGLGKKKGGFFPSWNSSNSCFPWFLSGFPSSLLFLPLGSLLLCRTEALMKMRSSGFLIITKRIVRIMESQKHMIEYGSSITKRTVEGKHPWVASIRIVVSYLEERIVFLIPLSSSTRFNVSIWLHVDYSIFLETNLCLNYLILLMFFRGPKQFLTYFGWKYICSIHSTILNNGHPIIFLWIYRQ